MRSARLACAVSREKVLIVGDPEQISPANVGIEKEKIHELNRQFLTSIPYQAVRHRSQPL